jgi:hypothetical protein
MEPATKKPRGAEVAGFVYPCRVFRFFVFRSVPVFSDSRNTCFNGTGDHDSIEWVFMMTWQGADAPCRH